MPTKKRPSDGFLPVPIREVVSDEIANRVALVPQEKRTAAMERKIRADVIRNFKDVGKIPGGKKMTGRGTKK
jgi:hypothetical protein